MARKNGGRVGYEALVGGGFGFSGSDGGKRKDEGRGLEGDLVKVVGDGEEGGLVATVCGCFPVAKGKERRMAEGCGDVMVSVGGFPFGGSGVRRQGCWCWFGRDWSCGGGRRRRGGGAATVVTRRRWRLVRERVRR
ncbi:hypothetical protein HAX54_013218 [Datura stramonium]|uniref:Uncharacterized protein n=1 Tax=Datura stramonium TaxID=4076 RepID=A0ABS8TMT1_DATST|nr:hypothetical protein [Datura stramonium]